MHVMSLLSGVGIWHDIVKNVLTQRVVARTCQHRRKVRCTGRIICVRSPTVSATTARLFDTCSKHESSDSGHEAAYSQNAQSSFSGSCIMLLAEPAPARLGFVRLLSLGPNVYSASLTIFAALHKPSASSFVAVVYRMLESLVCYAPMAQSGDVGKVNVLGCHEARVLRCPTPRLARSRKPSPASLRLVESLLVKSSMRSA
jgi:hypothetical protein